MSVTEIDSYRSGPAVYVLANQSGQRKVGYTSNLKRRDEEVSPKLPWPVELEFVYGHPLAKKIEPIAHKIMADVRCGRSEWFSCDLERIKNALEMATVVAAHKCQPKARAEESDDARSPTLIKAASPAAEVFKTKLSDRIAELRRAGTKQKDIAAEIGISSSCLNNYIKTEREPSLQGISDLCKALGCTPNDLFGFAPDEGAS